MEWHEKELLFQTKYANGTHVKDFWSRIPKKYHHMIDDYCIDSDGYWVYLADGYSLYGYKDEDTMIHAYTIKDIKDALRDVRKIDRIV